MRSEPSVWQTLCHCLETGRLNLINNLFTQINGTVLNHVTRGSGRHIYERMASALCILPLSYYQRLLSKAVKCVLLSGPDLLTTQFFNLLKTENPSTRKNRDRNLNTSVAKSEQNQFTGSRCSGTESVA